MATELLTTDGAIPRLTKLPPAEAFPFASAGGDAAAPSVERITAYYDAEKDRVFVLAGDGTVMEDSTGVCLGDMYISLLDEMKLRGFDATSAKFSIDRLPAA
jgi:hypothetical protein